MMSPVVWILIAVFIVAIVTATIVLVMKKEKKKTSTMPPGNPVYTTFPYLYYNNGTSIIQASLTWDPNMNNLAANTVNPNAFVLGMLPMTKMVSNGLNKFYFNNLNQVMYPVLNLGTGYQTISFSNTDKGFYFALTHVGQVLDSPPQYILNLVDSAGNKYNIQTSLHGSSPVPAFSATADTAQPNTVIGLAKTISPAPVTYINPLEWFQYTELGLPMPTLSTSTPPPSALTRRFGKKKCTTTCQ